MEGFRHGALILRKPDHWWSVVPPIAMFVKPSSGQSCPLSSCSKYLVAGLTLPQLSPRIRIRLLANELAAVHGGKQHPFQSSV